MKKSARFSQRGLTLVELMIGVVSVGIVAVGFFMLTGGFGLIVNNAEAVRAAETQGFTSPVVIDSHVGFVGWRGCSEDDGVAYDVRAVNPAGKSVTFKVCCGYIMKSCTVRSD